MTMTLEAIPTPAPRPVPLAVVRPAPRKRLRIAERFEGPPGVVNGGYAAGLLAERLGGAADVTLRRPTPTGADVTVKVRARSAWIEQDGEILVAAQERDLALDVPFRPSFEEARAARDRFPTAQHPFPECFVCGPDRAADDGLRLFAGPVAEGAVATPWVPDAGLSEDGCAGSPVRGRYVWAALDCPGAMAAPGGALPRPILLGQMHGAQTAPVRAGERYVVVGWTLARSGRRHEVATALLDAAGDVVAQSTQTWIEPRG